MNKNFRLKEISDWIKRSLKNKLSITKNLIIKILMCGAFMSFPVASYSDWWYFYIDKDTGAASHHNDAGESVTSRGSVLIAKTRGGDIISEANRHVKNSVIIGVDSYSIGDASTIIGAGSKGIGSQAQVLGTRSVAGSQSVAIGSETFATGSSSIAIGNDDIYNDGTGLEDKLPEKTIEKIYSDLWEKTHTFKGKTGRIFNSKQDFDKSYGIANGRDNRMYSPTFSRGLSSIAIGSRTVAYGNQSTALGTLNFALADKSTTIGIRSFVNFGATGGTAIGEESRVFAENSVAVGNKTEATNAGSMAYGYLSKAVGKGSIAIGHTVGSNVKLTSSSKNKFESNLSALQNGANTEKLINGNDDDISNLIKSTSQNGNKDVIEYEEESDVIMTTTKDIRKTKKEKDNAITIGYKSISSGLNSTVIGSSTAVFGSNSIGIGSLVHITEKAKNSLALGTGSHISESNSIGLGTATRVKSKDSMAFGVGSSVEENSNKSIAFGFGSKVSKDTTSGMALGNGAVANMANSVALGVNSKTDYGQDKLNKPGWVPLGSLSIPTSSKVGVISVGSINQERRITNVASGYALTDAANVAQLKALDDKINRLSVSENDGVRYMSVDRNSAGSKASELQEISKKQLNLNNYVEAKAQKLLIEARKKLNDESFDSNALKEIDDVIAKLGDKPEVKAHVKKLKDVENELNNTSDKSKFDEIMSKIDKAKTEDLKADVLTDAEKKLLADLNYNNNGAKGKDSIAIGYGAKAENTSDQGMALGFMSKSSSADSVALGSKSVANIAAGTLGYDPTTKTNSSDNGMAWKSTLGALSIGDTSKGLTRQIVGVSAGTNDTDAVNVAQLKNVVNKLDGLEKVSVENSGDIIQVTKTTPATGQAKYTIGINDVKLNEKVGETFAKKDGSNLSNEDVTKLKTVLGVSNLDLSYKAGDDAVSKTTTLQKGLHFKSKSDNLTVTSKNDGVLEFGLNETDKINTGALAGNGKLVTEKALIDYIKGNLGSIADDLADSRNTSGSANVDNLNGKHVNDKVNAIRRGEAGTVVYTNEKGDRVVKAKDGKWYKASDVVDGVSNAGATEVTNDKVRLSLVNEDGTTTKASILSNVADGNISVNSKDAINGSQLQKFGSNIAKALGGGAKFENGVLTDPTYVIKGNGSAGTNYTNIGDALKALDDAITHVSSNIGNSNLTYKSNGADDKKTTLTNGLNFTNTGNITASVEDNGVVKHTLNKNLKNIESIQNTDTGTKLTLGENELGLNDKKISGIKKGELSQNSTDAVTGSQLFDTNMRVKNLEDSVNGLGQGVISDTDPNNNKTVTGKAVYDYVEGKIKDTNSKIQEIANGQAGSVVYTNENGDRLVKGADNKYYLPSQLQADGMPKPGEAPVTNIKNSLVNADGTTTNATVLSNVGKGKVSENSTDAVNGSQLHEVEKKIDKAVNKLGEGLTFGADNASGKQELGSALTINKGDTSSGYKGDNLETKYEKDANGNGKITIGFKDRPEFSEIKVGDASNKVTIGAGTITGLKDLDDSSDSSSAVNKKYVDNKLSNYYNKREIDNRFDNYYDKDTVDKKLDTLGQTGQKALAGVANAIAMANLPQVQPSCGRNYALSGAYGTYGKESAFAVGLSGTTKKGDLVYKLSGSVNTKGNVGFGVGFAYVFGLKQNKSVCNLEYTSQNTNAVNSTIEQLKSENENIKETVQTLQNENKEMKELIKQILDRQVSSIKLFTLGGYISNKDVITKAQKKDLINIIDEINKNYIGRTIDITGYADTNGEDKFNLELGYRRAKKVVELLHSLGLSKTVKIGKVSSSGMNNMVSDINKSSNRRVEIIVR